MQIANTQKATQREVEAGISDSASWHARFKHSAYVFTGGLDYELTEGDILAVFSQYGEVVDLNLIRDKDTGKSKGFAFLAYEDQRSTVLAVDNLNGASVVNRKIRVEHVDNYKKRKAEVSPLLPGVTESKVASNPPCRVALMALNMQHMCLNWLSRWKGTALLKQQMSPAGLMSLRLPGELNDHRLG